MSTIDALAERRIGPRFANLGVGFDAPVPGRSEAIDTLMLRMMDDPEARGAYLRPRVSLRRLGRPEEGPGCRVLASNRRSYVTGTMVSVGDSITAM